MPSWAARSDYSVLRKGRMTMEGAQKYRVVAWWSSGRTGLAKSNSAPNAIHFTAPPEFGGLEGRWTPEDLLLSAVASCYTTLSTPWRITQNLSMPTWR